MILKLVATMLLLVIRGDATSACTPGSSRSFKGKENSKNDFNTIPLPPIKLIADKIRP
ncbi:MAG TPA: hypothetical protein VH413_03730 [Verrucomicrobiae bacterium]|jgi:hypothetical protein|nr:hypothetical protein [Verrucomicrobiae bacterium]